MADKITYEYFTSFLYRSPVFPHQYLYNYDLFKTDIFKEAVYVASPDLYQVLLDNEGKRIDEMPLNVQLSLLKYLTRMSTRCTPFGLFAGCGTAKLGDKTTINIDGFKSYTRFDMNFLCSLVQKLNQLESVKNKINFYPNNTLYKIGDEYRYIEYTYKNGARKHFLTSIESNQYLDEIFKLSKGGVSLEDLKNSFVDEENTLDDVTEFLDQLLENQLLVGDLEPTVIGKDVLDQLIKTLKTTNAGDDIITYLNLCSNKLKSLDNQKLGRQINLYTEIEDDIKVFDVTYEKKFLFQSDVFIQSSNSFISSQIAEDAKSILKILNKLSNRYSENQHLKKFKEDLNKRYEDEEISLIEALDTDIGVGFSNLTPGDGDNNPLIEGLALGLREGTERISVQEGELFLIEKYNNCIAAELDEINITDDDLSHIEETWDDLPQTLGSMIEILETDNDTNESIIKMTSAIGSSAANLLGRFCHINTQIEAMVKEIVEKEQEIIGDEKLVAEIVHLPESRTGNVLYRPNFRNYEIPYLAKHSVDDEFVLPITDLMISAVQGDRLLLRSKKLNKEVVVKLSNAHNYSYDSLPLYHFLCLYQHNNLRSDVYFSWGSYLSKKEFLPRVKYKKHVLSPATWNITEKDTLHMPDFTSKAFPEFVGEFRKKRKLPDRVLLAESDNKLFIDFNNSLSSRLFFSEIKGKAAVIEEALIDYSKSPIKGQNGLYANQVIINFFKQFN